MFVSIIIPTYNYAHFLPDALHSILNQYYFDYEVIVVDDGSTDDTQAVLQSFIPQFNDNLIIIAQKNAGPGAARNRGMQAAQGKYILFLDADDQLTMDALIDFRRAAAQNTLADLIIAGHISEENGKEKQYHGSTLLPCNVTNLRRYFRKKINVCNGAMLMTKKWLQHIRFPENLPLCEDIPFFAQALATANCVSISQATVKIRKHPESRRHDFQALSNSIEALPGLVFNADIIPPLFYSLKREFAGRMHLRMFRALYQAKHFTEARHYYYRALKTYPRLLFLGPYFRKFIKSFFHRTNIKQVTAS